MKPAMHGGLSVHFSTLVIPSGTDHPFFVGASMTLVGLLPPLCDNGNLLVDGGYSKLPCVVQNL